MVVETRFIAVRSFIEPGVISFHPNTKVNCIQNRFEVFWQLRENIPISAMAMSAKADWGAAAEVPPVPSFVQIMVLY